MAGAYARRRSERPNYWPGFVDALATLLLVFTFLLSVFMLSQFFLSREVSGKDTVLSRLNVQIAELSALLALERAGGQDIQSEIARLRAGLQAAEGDKTRLQGLIDEKAGAAATAGGAATQLGTRLEQERQLTARALTQVELLNQQIAALRRQIGALESALDASDVRNKDSQGKLEDLGKRLNVALAQRVQELARYRSDFFGRLREILGNRPEIRVVGDRFVFQSEVLFPSGSEEINPAGRAEIDKLAQAIVQLEREIPADISWTLRVDGHTDARPISGFGRFRSNWDLSAARAISVVRALVDRGVSPKHLVAAGYGEHQPLEEGTSTELDARNRRIELKLTDR